MGETVREWIARLAEEMQRCDGWMEIEPEDDAPQLVAGSLHCLADAVEFDDDSGLRAVVAYRSIRAVNIGRQGETDFAARHFSGWQEPLRKAG